MTWSSNSIILHLGPILILLFSLFIYVSQRFFQICILIIEKAFAFLYPRFSCSLTTLKFFFHILLCSLVISVFMQHLGICFSATESEFPLNLRSHSQMFLVLKLKRNFLFPMNVIIAESLAVYRFVKKYSSESLPKLKQDRLPSQ